jgi:hypothetical protein
MADVWLATVSSGSISVTGHTPGLGPIASVAAKLFVVADGTDAGPTYPFESAHSFAILGQVFPHSFGGGPTYEWRATYTFLQKPFPANPFDGWVQILQPDVIPSPSSWFSITQTQADGNNGAAFFSGGDLTIEKDWAMGKYVFGTPLGSVDVPFDWFPNQPPITNPSWTVADTPLYASGLGYAFGYADNTVNNQGTIKWFDFFTKKNSVNVAGAHLTAADPGTFDPLIILHWQSAGATYDLSGVDIPSTSAQEFGSYRMQLTASIGDNFEATQLQRYIAPGGAAASGLDIASMDEHAVIFRGFAVPMARTDLEVSRSHDAGHSWTDYLAVSDAYPKSSVSLALFAGLVYAVYYDETSTTTKQVISRDLGNSWSSPVPISITGTNPRLVIAPDGPFFYFYLSSGSMLLQRSFDLGATLVDVTPIPVATLVDTADFAAIWTADRSLVVAYTSGNVWKTRRSVDLGNTWANA